jgi:pimeloyl-ACP methyl ester carboxylesterase
MSMARIHRGFIELPGAQMHYRHAGQDGCALPLVLVHASPGSSAGLAHLAAAMSSDRRVIAPDTLGNGDSVGDIPQGADITFFAGRLLETLDALGLQRFDLYGTHTGASLATELALRHPDRVGALVLDGVGLYPPDFQQELLERYAPALKLDHQAGYLMWVWHFVRDTYMYWPWYRLDREHRRDGSLPAPEVLHAKVVEVLKAATTYHHSYRAAMAYDKRGSIPRLTVPTLAACARHDMLHIYFDELCALVPGGRGEWIAGIHTEEAARETAACLRRFFDASRPPPEVRAG